VIELFHLRKEYDNVLAVDVGLALQVGVIGVVLTAISGRLQRPMQAGAAA